jgi:hypothetical protein
MAKLDLAFQLSANADGVAAGVAQADRELSKVGKSAKATAAEFRQAAKMTAELRTPSEKYADTVARIDAMMQKGILSQEVYGRAMAKADAELKAATSSMDKMASSASMTERIVNGLSGAIGGVADATKSVSEAGVSVIRFGKDIAWTYLQWKVFSAVRNPAGFKDFAVGALKGAAAARTMILAAKALGVGLALGGGAAGTAAAAVLGLSNPLIGGALLALNLGRAFLSAKKRAFEMAAAVKSGTVSLQQLNGQLGVIQARQVKSLAVAMNETAAAGKRSKSAFAGFSDVFVTPFVGAFAAIQSGLAGFTGGISGVVEGVTSIMSPIAQAIAPVFTLIGTLVEGVLKFVGVMGESLGIVLKVAGAVVHTFLSPFIVGLANSVEMLRGGMNAGFKAIGRVIDVATKKLQGYYEMMSKVQVLGTAFAAGLGDQSKRMITYHQGRGDFVGAGDAAAESAGAGGDLELEIYKARLQNQAALAEADKKAADDRMSMEMEIYKARKANDEALANARKKEELDKLAMFAIQRENEQAIADANRKRQEEAAKIGEKAAEKQADIDAMGAERADALRGRSNESLKSNDIRSGEGMAQFLALATGREDPAIEEYRKQTQKLDEIRAELRALQQEKVDILGAAA